MPAHDLEVFEDTHGVRVALRIAIGGGILIAVNFFSLISGFYIALMHIFEAWSDGIDPGSTRDRPGIAYITASILRTSVQPTY